MTDALTVNKEMRSNLHDNRDAEHVDITHCVTLEEFTLSICVSVFSPEAEISG